MPTASQRLLPLLLLAFLIPGLAHGQEESDTVKRRLAAQVTPDSVHHRNECRRAVQIVRTGNPPPHRAWAYGYIRLCGAEGGRALADGIRSARTSTDRAALEDLTRPTLYLIDGNIVDASHEVARDRASSDAARVLALRALLVAARPGATPSYAEMTGKGAIGAGCVGFDLRLHDPTLHGAPLPTGAHQRTYTLANEIIRSPLEPVAVKHAARCAARIAHKRILAGASPQP